MRGKNRRRDQRDYQEPDKAPWDPNSTYLSLSHGTYHFQALLKFYGLSPQPDDLLLTFVKKEDAKVQPVMSLSRKHIEKK